jgi:hypothetical protein
MNLYKILICIALISFSCDKKKSKPVLNNLVETKNNDKIVETENNDKIIVSGEYIFYENAGVLQTNKNIYGIIINDKVIELNQKLSSIKKDEYHFIPVILKGKLHSKSENENGWPVKLEITEIVEIINKEI